MIAQPPLERPLLEIEIHLSSGRTHRFVQNDPALAQQVLQQINLKTFTRPSLVLAGHNRSAAYAGPALIGISLLMETIPEGMLNFDALHALPLEITEDDYWARREEAKPSVKEQAAHWLVEIEFTNGRRLWLEVQGPQAGSGMQERHLLHNLFSMPCLPCRRLGGGVSLWNGAQMTSCSFTPDLDAPSNAWPAEFVR